MISVNWARWSLATRGGPGESSPVVPSAPEGVRRGNPGASPAPRGPKVEEKQERRLSEDKRRDRAPPAVKGEVPSEEEDEFVEESEESAPREEDPPVAAKAEPAASRPGPHTEGKVYRGSVGRALGLREL